MTIPSHLFRLSSVRPALSALIVATLAIGIGSATALYSVIEAVLFRPYPFREQSASPSSGKPTPSAIIRSLKSPTSMPATGPRARAPSSRSPRCRRSTSRRR
jgi:hypothetical protein